MSSTPTVWSLSAADHTDEWVRQEMIRPGFCLEVIIDHPTKPRAVVARLKSQCTILAAQAWMTNGRRSFAMDEVEEMIAEARRSMPASALAEIERLEGLKSQLS
jgi:hypothetical protein